MKNVILVSAILLTAAVSHGKTSGGEKLIHTLKTEVYTLELQGSNCKLVIEYNSATSISSGGPIRIDAKLMNDDIEILTRTAIDDVKIEGNVVTLIEKINPLKKATIVVKVDDNGNPVSASAKARKYLQSGKIDCQLN